MGPSCGVAGGLGRRFFLPSLFGFAAALLDGAATAMELDGRGADDASLAALSLGFGLGTSALTLGDGGAIEGAALTGASEVFNTGFHSAVAAMPPPPASTSPSVERRTRARLPRAAPRVLSTAA